MDPNNPNQTTNPLNPLPSIPQPDSNQQDTSQPQVTADPQSQTFTHPSPPTQTEPISTMQSDPNNYQMQQPVASLNTVTQNNQNTSQPDGSYIKDVGEELITLLDDINESEKLTEIVAKEMQLDANQVKSILAKLLDKIDQEQITTEELALIMASTVADEASEEE